MRKINYSLGFVLKIQNLLPNYLLFFRDVSLVAFLWSVGVLEWNHTTLALLVKLFLQILFITETFVFMPIFHKGDMLKKKMLNHTKISYCLTLPLIALIYAPRLLNVSLILATLQDGFYSIYVLLAMFLVHTFCFVILILTMYRDEWRKNKAPLLQSFFTSMFAPCIVMSPSSNLLLFSNLLSTIPHVISTSVMIAVAKNNGVESNDDGVGSLASILIPWLLISPMFAWLLQAYSQEKTQEILVNGISFKLVKFFGSMFVLKALDEVSDILTAMEYFFK